MPNAQQLGGLASGTWEPSGNNAQMLRHAFKTGKKYTAGSALWPFRVSKLFFTIKLLPRLHRRLCHQSTKIALKYKQMGMLKCMVRHKYGFDKHFVNELAKNGAGRLLRFLARHRVPCFNSETISHAVAGNQAGCLKILLDHGIPMDNSDANKSIMLGHLECFELLLEEGIELDEQCLISAINLRQEHQSRKLVDVLLEYDVPMGSAALYRKNDITIYRAIMRYIYHPYNTNVYVSMRGKCESVKTVDRPQPNSVVG
jgi:hypothetical protein